MAFTRIFCTTTVALVALAGPALAATQATGRVQDASGKALPHVYVHQLGGVTATFTDEQGNFRLDLDPKAGTRLILSAPGYQGVEIDAAQLRAPVTLKPAPLVTAPKAPAAPEAAPTSGFASGYGLRYGWRNQTLASSGNSVGGLINNELGLNARIRQDAWVWGLDAYRNRAAVSLPSLTAGTTFTPETVQAELSLGYLFGSGSLEVVPRLTALYRSVTANTQGAAYSGTPLDYDETRQAVGLGAAVGYRLMPGLDCLVEGDYFPGLLTSETLKEAPSQLSGLQGLKVGLKLGYALVPGLQLQAGYQHESWGATNYAQDADVVLLGIVSRPAEVRP